jgi:translocator protein
MDKTGPNAFQIANVAAIVIALFMNFLANWLPINGVNTGQVADSYPNLFTPPGYIFIIWGVIYMLAIVFAVYQVRQSQRSEPYLGSIGWLYLVSALINAVWILVFHYSYGTPTLYLASTVLLLLLLADLLLIYRKLDIGGADAPRGVKLCVHAPMSIYVGWISVASIAGLASALNIIFPGISVATQATVTAAMLVVALTLACIMLWLRRDAVFALVVIWAVSGIANKQAAVPIINLTALAVMGVTIVALLLIPIIRKMNWITYYTS